MAGAATVEKALDVLFHLHDAGAALGLSEIGRALDLPKSSCHRLLSSLVDREIVDRDENGRYRPGLALLALGIGAQRGEPVISAARPVLETEAVRLGETVFLVGLRHDRLRVLDKVEGPGFLRAAPGVGDVIPKDVTAAGKLYEVFGRSPSGDSIPTMQCCGEQRWNISKRQYPQKLSHSSGLSWMTKATRKTTVDRPLRFSRRYSSPTRRSQSTWMSCGESRKVSNQSRDRPAGSSTP